VRLQGKRDAYKAWEPFGNTTEKQSGQSGKRKTYSRFTRRKDTTSSRKEKKNGKLYWVGMNSWEKHADCLASRKSFREVPGWPSVNRRGKVASMKTKGGGGTELRVCNCTLEEGGFSLRREKNVQT